MKAVRALEAQALQSNLPGQRDPGRAGRPRQPLQQVLFDAIQIADGLEQTTGIDLTGRGNK